MNQLFGKVRVVYFGDSDWGFSDAVLPRLQAVLARSDLAVDVWHSGLTFVLWEGDLAATGRALALIEELRSLPECQSFKVGIADGEARGVSIAHVTAAAIANAKWPNKAPEPTPGAVTPRATEGTSK